MRSLQADLLRQAGPHNGDEQHQENGENSVTVIRCLSTLLPMGQVLAASGDSVASTLSMASLAVALLTVLPGPIVLLAPVAQGAFGTPAPGLSPPRSQKGASWPGVKA
jgi:hypothetical protein